MMEQLRKIFSSLIVYNDTPATDTDKYQWFTTSENQVIGIDKNELSDKDVRLLSTFLQPHNIAIPVMTPEEQQWNTYISTENPDETDPVTYRFIYFSFQKYQIEPVAFKEAINTFFDKQIPVLWVNDHEGFIVEANYDENISYEQIIDVLMSDLSVKIYFFVGPYLYKLSDAKGYYQMLINGAKIAAGYSEKSVITYIDAVPFLFMDQTEQNIRTEIIDTILGKFADDDDMLKTIETFIACNLNISVTAKELYMHRNSLQYRLDKFTEVTGIDIKQFHQAMTVYLALLARN
ncbi:PucR family transcriptional regulator [Virgibacillus doumboii]|uniref:PucR family transcriptional regulator n=1 Tax=Virgibacillus doumboii TaxID=2697503 RepID=UPI0013E069EA|nr:helix-turn-helix domain-containing protein [Virgibacillus doumboii]